MVRTATAMVPSEVLHCTALHCTALHCSESLRSFRRKAKRSARTLRGLCAVFAAVLSIRKGIGRAKPSQAKRTRFSMWSRYSFTAEANDIDVTACNMQHGYNTLVAQCRTGRTGMFARRACVRRREPFSSRRSSQDRSARSFLRACKTRATCCSMQHVVACNML